VGHEHATPLGRRLEVVQGVVERLTQSADLVVRLGQGEAHAG
jgi:hypothetical protein